jgi:hypothetical protein
MPDPWRLYVKQSSSTTTQQQIQTMPKKDSSSSDSLSNLTELIDQELNLNSNSFDIINKSYYSLFSSINYSSIRFI